MTTYAHRISPNEKYRKLHNKYNRISITKYSENTLKSTFIYLANDGNNPSITKKNDENIITSIEYLYNILLIWEYVICNPDIIEGTVQNTIRAII